MSVFGLRTTDDIEVFAKRRLLLTPTLKEISNISGRRITINGLNAYELVADAKDEKSDTAVVVYQTIVLGKERYYLMQGLVGASQRDQYLAEFRWIASTLKVLE